MGVVVVVGGDGLHYWMPAEASKTLGWARSGFLLCKVPEAKALV